MANPANAAVREKRRNSTPQDLERLNVIKALTAAEHSRRQFVLNFAASKDTKLLVPGQKSGAVKAAEEWAAAWLSRNGHEAANHEFFKYTVDARLWATHVGSDLEFPFAFMRERVAPRETSSQNKGEVIDTRSGEMIPTTPRDSPKASPPRTQPAPSPLSTKHRDAADIMSDKKRSMSLTSIDELKTPKVAQEKLPFIARLGRSWSRRLSSSS